MIRVVVQILVSVALLALMLMQVDVGLVLEEMAGLPPAVPLTVIPLLGSVLILSQGIRWRAVLAALGIAAPAGPVLRMVSLAYFANQILPSAGGDLLRVWLGRRLRADLRTLIASVLLDRVAGLVTIVGTCLLTLPLFYAATDGGALFWPGLLTILAGLAGVGVLFGSRHLPSFLVRFRVIREVEHLAVAAWTVLRDTRRTLAILGLSLVSHTALFTAIFVLVSVTGAELRLIDAVAVVPVVLLIAMLPITMGGWGLREGAMVIGLGIVGVPAEAALAASILLGGMMAAVGVIGGAVWVVAGRADDSAPQEDRGAG